MLTRRPAVRGWLAPVMVLALAAAAQATTGRVRLTPPSAGRRTDARTTRFLASGPGSYVVRRGDTLFDLAQRFGLTIETLSRANRLRSRHRITVGQVLKVPAPAARQASVPLRGLPPDLLRRPDRLSMARTFDAAARRRGVSAALLKAVTWQESGWQNSVVSQTKAVGVGQLMPDTVRFVNQQLLRTNLNPARSDQNIELSAGYLAWLLRWSGGDVPKAVAGYYQGPTSVQQKGLLPETQSYVENVLALHQRFSS